MMDTRKIVGEARDSLIILKRNYKIVSIGVVIELAFVLLLGFFTAPFRNGIINNLEQLGGEIITAGAETGNELASVAISSGFFRNIIILGIILAAVGYSLYCLFHGVIWKLCFNLVGKKGKYVPYIKKFFHVNIFWYLFFIMYVIINFFFSYVDLVGQRLDPEEFFFLGNLTNLILIFIAYFAFISYVLIDKESVWKSIKSSFNIGFRKFLWLLVTYFIIALIYLALKYLLALAGMVSYYLLVFMGIFLVMPAMIWGRIFIKKIVDRL